MKRIYLDNASTTKTDKKVFEAMKPYFIQSFGNPGSISLEGKEAKETLEESRKKIAELIGASTDEIIFTSGATEANNLAIFGVVKERINRGDGKIHIITEKTEHKSVLAPFGELEKKNFDVTYLPVNEFGLVDPKQVAEALRKETVLVSIMQANNEIGTIQPITEIAKVIKRRRGDGKYPVFHVDSAQAPGFLDINVNHLHPDLMSFSAQKFYGPKGVGFLYKRRGISIEPIIYGGGQEFGVRSGTENIPLVVGMTLALLISSEKREEESERLTKMRDRFLEKILNETEAILNGHPRERLPGNINISFPGISGEWLVISLDAKGVSASTGSACSGEESSHVIMSLGERNGYSGEDLADSAIRLSLGRETKEKDLDFVINSIKTIIEKQKSV